MEDAFQISVNFTVAVAELVLSSRYVLETLGGVWHNDARVWEQKLSLDTPASSTTPIRSIV